MQSETRIDMRVKINTSIAANVTKYINLHTHNTQKLNQTSKTCAFQFVNML